MIRRDRVRRVDKGEAARQLRLAAQLFELTAGWERQGPDISGPYSVG
jgi:hypothetical protein